MNNCSELLSFVERLSCALKDVRQAPFDWHLSDDRLDFSISFPEGSRNGLSGISNAIGSSDLVPLIHSEDKQALQLRLHNLLQAGDAADSIVCRFTVSSRDANGQWRLNVEIETVPIHTGGLAAGMDGREASADDNDLRYRELVELAPDAIFVCCASAVTLLNQAAGRLLGVSSANELVGRSMTDFIHPDHRTLFFEPMQGPEPGAPNSSVAEQVWIRLDGSTFHAEIASSDMMYNGMPALQMVVRDISERKRAEELQLGQNRILNMVATGVPLQEILNEISRLVEAQSNGKSCCVMLLDSRETTLPEDGTTRLTEAFGTQVETLSPQIIVKDASGDALWSSLRKTPGGRGIQACSSWPIFGKDRQLLGAIALYSNDKCTPIEQERQLLDICANLAGIAIESRAAEERMRYLAYYDGLTSLPNRFLFKEYLDLALCNAHRHQRKFAVFFLDLDKFKQINDTLGHDTGDYVLREIATRLRARLRNTDRIARMGGDEFYVLIENLSDGSYAADVAQKLLEEAARPVMAGQQKCLLSASIGIAIYPEHGEDAQALLKNADSAMYLAKALGSNNFQFFRTGMEDKDRKEKALHRFRDLMEGHNALIR